ncbi:hypothetical protein PVAP13_8KG213701 [Panicum virgatum]|uniref:DUF8039 domain-containing protein n=1 Tax=Panicum virgatum TaxID=38727 RepID=A0A8T0PMG7_PANVG|nr:hypothetical protein PVAP13_8KG213701 [Panicum virgatum]
MTWERENDLLSACLGPEQPGRVRGLSSYHGWKRAWPECSGVSRKRKRASSVDVDAIKAELRAELTQDILSMLASPGIQLQPFSRGPSPAPGRRSSCASASAADIRASMPPMPEDASCFDDTIDRLTEPTPCSLVTTRGGYQMEVAKGLVYPQQTILHSVLILFGYAVVKVEMVIDDAKDIELVPPPNDEIRTLGEAILQRIQWKRSCIVVNRISSEKPSERVPGTAFLPSLTTQTSSRQQNESMWCSLQCSPASTRATCRSTQECFHPSCSRSSCWKELRDSCFCRRIKDV